MSLLSRFRILTKILAVIALLSIGAAGITVLGIASLKRIAEQTGLVSRTASEALLLARINTNLQALNAGIYRIVSDPRPESRREARAAIEKEAATFKKRFAALSELVVSEESKMRLAQISNEWVALSADLETVYQAAEAVQDFQMTQEMQRVRDAAGSTDKMVDSLRTSLRNMIEIYDQRVTTVNSDAGAVYVQVSTLMTVVASASVLISLVLGFLIGQYGVAKPMRGLVAVLQKLASGDYGMEIEGTDRRDEIGEVAKTALVFKENGLTKIRMEKEQRDLEERVAADRAAAAAAKLRMEQEQEQQRKEMENRAAAEREAAAAKLASEFEAAVGAIVQAAVAGDFSRRRWRGTSPNGWRSKAKPA